MHHAEYDRERLESEVKDTEDESTPTIIRQRRTRAGYESYIPQIKEEGHSVNQ